MANVNNENLNNAANNTVENTDTNYGSHVISGTNYTIDNINQVIQTANTFNAILKQDPLQLIPVKLGEIYYDENGDPFTISAISQIENIARNALLSLKLVPQTEKKPMPTEDVNRTVDQELAYQKELKKIGEGDNDGMAQARLAKEDEIKAKSKTASQRKAEKEELIATCNGLHGFRFIHDVFAPGNTGKYNAHDYVVLPQNILYNPESRLGASIDIGLPSAFNPFGDGYGINIPSDQRYIKSNLTANIGLIEEMIAFKPKATMSDQDKAVANIYKTEWIQILTGKRSPLVSNFIDAASLPVARSVSLSGDELAHKKIPNLDWFDQKIKDLSIKDIIPIFRDPELELLTLHIGRIVCGASSQDIQIGCVDVPTINIAEKIQDPITGEIKKGGAGFFHTYRTLPILCGSPGTGKSHLVKWVASALNKCGYRTDSMALSGNQFGYGILSRVDLCYSDDLTKDQLGKLYNTAQIKTATTSGIFPDEAKGKDARSARAIGAMLLCANNTIVSEKYFDEGSEERFIRLATKEAIEIEKELGMEYDKYIIKLCRKLKTTPDVIFAYLLRLCADKFIHHIGYIWDPNDRVYYHADWYGEKYENLKSVTLRNRAQCVAPTRDNLEFMLVAASRKVQAVNSYLVEIGVMPEQYLNPSEVNDKGFTIANMIQMAQMVSGISRLAAKCKVHPDGNDIKPGMEQVYEELNTIRNWILPDKQFSVSSINNWYSFVANTVAENPHRVVASKLWKDCVNMLETNNRGSLRVDNVNYMAAYNRSKALDTTYKQQLADMMGKPEDNKVQAGLFGKLASIKAKYLTFEITR